MLADIQGGVVGGPAPDQPQRAASASWTSSSRSERGTLRLVGAGLAGLAVLEAAEAVGLWFQRRWAEYLTFVVTDRCFSRSRSTSSRLASPGSRSIALVVNLAIVVYLLVAKRLFGLRGGVAADGRSAGATSGGRLSSGPRPGAATRPDQAVERLREGGASVAHDRAHRARRGRLDRAAPAADEAGRGARDDRDAARQVGEPGLRADPKPAARRADDPVARDQRAVLDEPEHRLAGAPNRARLDPGGQRSRLAARRRRPHSARRACRGFADESSSRGQDRHRQAALAHAAIELVACSAWLPVVGDAAGRSGRWRRWRLQQDGSDLRAASRRGSRASASGRHSGCGRSSARARADLVELAHAQPG